MFTCLSPLTGLLVLQVHRSCLFHIVCLTSLGAWYSTSAYKWLWNSHRCNTWGMRASGCPKWTGVVKNEQLQERVESRVETSSARFCSVHDGQLVSQAKGGSSKRQLIYLSASKGDWFSTGAFGRNPFSLTFWFPTCKIIRSSFPSLEFTS